PLGGVAGIKGGWLGLWHHYPSEMAQNFWTAIWAFGACFTTTVAISLATRAPAEEQLHGLVYSMTPRVSTENEPWWRRPVVLGVAALTLTALLNLIFA
ncbi:MAG: Na+/galactose cotransporter, partial [Proteobacteria bacterium]|nr:Na+/galactose cotransporter [Pseudomonadota bacterium]